MDETVRKQMKLPSLKEEWSKLLVDEISQLTAMLRNVKSSRTHDQFFRTVTEKYPSLDLDEKVLDQMLLCDELGLLIELPPRYNSPQGKRGVGERNE